MNQVVKLMVALAMGAAMIAPVQAKSDDSKGEKKDSFVEKLAKAAEDVSKDSKKSDSDSKSDDDKKDVSDKKSSKADKKDSKKSEKDSKLSDLIKSSDSKTKTTNADKALVLTITGNIQERSADMTLFGKQPESLKKYVDTLRRARMDDEIKTVVLRMGPNDLGMATSQELREAIAQLRKNKKKVISILEDDSQASYLVASAADEVVIPPSGDLMLHGVSADSYFLKNLLDKFGVKVQIIHIGQYKSYGETYTQDDFTTPARMNMDEIINGVYAQVTGMLAESRNITQEQAEAAFDAGPVGAKDALSKGMVDRIAYADEVLKQLEDDDQEIVKSDDYKTASKGKSGTDISLLGLLSMMSKSDDSDDSGSKDYPRVAVLYAVGSITLGSNDDSGFGSSTGIASQDIIDELEKIKEDDKIKAVILRVNSPGGSAFASDLIWKKIEELKKKKPVVASMGDVAASGGYYISMGATKIVAQPGTLTGSIGVVGGKPNLKGLYDKLGVSKTTISKGRYAGLFSESTDFSPEEHDVIQSMMKRTYDEFVNKAANGRSKTYEQVNEVAQGRVWIGAKAKEVGLVDELGGLDTAIVETKSLIGLKSDDKVRLIAYPKEKSIVDIIQKAFGASASTVQMGTQSVDGFSVLLGSLPLPTELRSVLQQATTITRMFNQEKVLTVMPMMIKLH